MLNIRTVQESATDKVTGISRLIRETPYIRFRYAQEHPIFVQEGSFYYEDGTVIPPYQLPEWAVDAVTGLSPEAQNSVGLLAPLAHAGTEISFLVERQDALVLDLPVPVVDPDLSGIEFRDVNYWRCDQCEDAVPLNRKGLHIGAHTRKAKQEAKLHGDSAR